MFDISLTVIAKNRTLAQTKLTKIAKSILLARLESYPPPMACIKVTHNLKALCIRITNVGLISHH